MFYLSGVINVLLFLIASSSSFVPRNSTGRKYNRLLKVLARQVSLKSYWLLNIQSSTKRSRLWVSLLILYRFLPVHPHVGYWHIFVWTLASEAP
jgi:hypothetical protein